MPKVVSPLTNTQIKNVRPSIKPLTMFDGLETGLHLLVQPNGTKTFRLKIQIDGKDRRLTLGTFPDMSLAEARVEASKNKKQVKQGIDPTEPLVVNTFERVAEKFIQWNTTSRKCLFLKGSKLFSFSFEQANLDNSYDIGNLWHKLPY